jgi:hypothetical protein
VQQKTSDTPDTFDIYVSVLENGKRTWNTNITPTIREAAECLVSVWNDIPC